ncbi:MAG: O-antigen ligase family protein [Colwellia sp.]|jgi:Lipid A core - O-antigen ligase and related enzymes
MISLQIIQQLTPKNALALLALGFFIIQPWDRYLADAFWLLLSLSSLIYICTKKYLGQSLNTPEPLKNLLWLFTLMPLVSVISYLASPLDALTPKALEPDTRWLLIIPIILAMCNTQIGPKWVLAFIAAYAVSTFTSATIETNYLTHLGARANGDENAVPYGMFNATIALMLLAYFISPYIKNAPQKQHKVKIARTLIFIIFALAVAAAFLSGTRSAILVLPIVITLLYTMHYNLKKTLIGLTLLLGLGAVFIGVQTDSSFVKRLISTPVKVSSYFIKNDRTSKLRNPRLEQWKESTCIFTIHPILGTGPRSFKYAHQTYGGKGHCDAVQYLKQGSYQAHSVYFNTLGTLGLAGIVATLLLSLTLIRTGITAFKQNNNTIKLGGSLLITAVACHAINGINLDLWFMNHVMDKNLLVLGLPLLLIFNTKKTGNLIDRSLLQAINASQSTPNNALKSATLHSKNRAK